MCGIVCAFDLKQDSETLRPQILEMSKHRKFKHSLHFWTFSCFTPGPQGTQGPPGGI